MADAPVIHIHGGILTIGGTKVIVQDGEYRVLFDFGSAYAPGGDFWGGRLHARSSAGRLVDMVKLGYAPAVDGLYRPGQAERLGLTPGADGKTHVFISHLHLDHMALVDLLAEDMPVWMHEDGLRLFRAVAETGEEPAVPAGARGFQYGQEIQVGPITVTPVAVDHDIPGACALLIKTSAGVVVYSGDLRLHGPHPERVEAFIEQAKALHPKVLFIEGTRLGEPAPTPERPAGRSENEVAPAIAAQLQEVPGLGLITLYPRNTLRIEALAQAVKAVGRTLVLSPEAAHIYRETVGNLDGIAVYQRDKDGDALAAGTAPAWLRNLFETAPTLDSASISKEQSKYLLQLFFWDLGELNDLQPQEGSLFIHSNGEPLGRFDPTYDLFLRWLDHFGVELVGIGATGHASAPDLHKVVAGIAPDVLMPIHSKAPELLEVPGIRRVLPELGATYSIETGERLK